LGFTGLHFGKSIKLFLHKYKEGKEKGNENFGKSHIHESKKKDLSTKSFQSYYTILYEVIKATSINRKSLLHNYS